MGKSSLWKTLCIVVVFWAATTMFSPAQTLTTLYSFCSQPICADGSAPGGPLLQGTDGNFYGTTAQGGTNFDGTVFKITPNGTLTTLYSFCAQTGCPDGEGPGGLVQATDGNFYGMTLYGGNLTCNAPYGCGTLFKITSSGTLTTLYVFCSQSGCRDGYLPVGGLMQATDGNFYGTTEGSGGYGSYGGTVFKITPAGTLTTLYTFCSQWDCPDGSDPMAGLVQATDGNFYGTTGIGGAHVPGGTVFKITPSGTLTTLYSFCSQPYCSDGYWPYAGLVQATDGNFYGTTGYGGYNPGYGTVFKITAGGTLTTLHSFDGTDGSSPYAGLVQATDGNFYGTTPSGRHGDNCNGDCGTVFKITAGGVLTTLYSFCAQPGCPDGSDPVAGLVQATDGTFYGTTSRGGASNDCCGTVFRLSVGLGPFVETQPTMRTTSGKVGAPVIILGTNLTGATGVTFNGTAASFNVVSPAEITTNVPAGATTGLVQVTGTPSGTLSSNATFQITTPVQFVPVAPCRLLDTRKQYGGSGPIQGGTFESFNLPQAAKQSKGCPTLDLSSAAAYSLNVTVVPQEPLGYLTVWPTGEVTPYVSTMNSVDGRVKANAAIVPAGSNAVSVFASNTTDVVLDIDGYFAPASPSTLAFYPLPPCRVADTRDPSYPNDLGPPYLSGQQERDFPVLNATSCNIPSSAQAYSLNFTAVPHAPLGYLSVWPAGQLQPLVSTLNAITGAVTANAAIVPAGKPNGEIAVFPSSDTDLVIDINGYFAPAGKGGLSLYPSVPCRVLDTRNGNGAFQGTLSPPVDFVNSPCGIPSTALGLVVGATVVPSMPLGFLALWPEGASQPLVSTLNSVDGTIVSNMAVVPTSNGKIDAYASSLTQLIIDISSYFAP